MRSRAGDDAPITDVQQEEDKAKMLLGVNFLVSILTVLNFRFTELYMFL